MQSRGGAAATPGEPPPQAPAGQHPTFIVCGSGSLALRLVKDLMRLDEPITVIIGNRVNPFADQLTRTGAHVIYGPKRDVHLLRQAGVEHATALALVDSDDVGNVHTALAAQELNPRLRLVMRMYRRRLAMRIESLFDECTLLSPADIAAPSFADAALGDGSHLVRVAGRVLQAGRPGSVSSVLATLAETDLHGNVNLLPDVEGAAPPGEQTQHEASEFVLGEPVKGKDELAKIPPLETLLTASRPLSWVSRYKPPRWRTLLAFFSALASTRLRILGVALLLLGGVAVLGFELIWEHSWLDSIFTAVSVVTGTGYGELLGAGVPTGMKFFGTGVMLLGLFVIAILIASVVDDFMSERRVQRLSVPMGKPTGHVITCGLGRVGVRVAERLLEVGVQVVAIEKDPNNPRLAIARTMGLPVVTGDATQEETLRAARVEHARCVLAVTSDDITNLETGLATRSMRPAMPVVLRLFDGDLARRVDRRLGLTTSRSVSFAAAPVFAAAMLDRAVLAVIPYGPRVLLVAELPVDEGQELYGQPLSMLSRTGQLRVLAHQRGTVTTWAPPLTTAMAVGDRVIVIATRDGLSAVLPQTTDLAAIAIAGPVPARLARDRSAAGPASGA